jgi:GDPmannose 4,6-dehydratase
MWLILQQQKPDDYVLATGETHSVREFVELAFSEIGITIEWVGSGTQERGLCSKSGRDLVQIDPHYFRPTEVDVLLGDASKARKQLGWKPRVWFRDLVREMVASDVKRLSADFTLVMSAMFEDLRPQ